MIYTQTQGTEVLHLLFWWKSPWKPRMPGARDINPNFLINSTAQTAQQGVGLGCAAPTTGSCSVSMDMFPSYQNHLRCQEIFDIESQSTHYKALHDCYAATFLEAKHEPEQSLIFWFGPRHRPRTGCYFTAAASLGKLTLFPRISLYFPVHGWKAKEWVPPGKN